MDGLPLQRNDPTCPILAIDLESSEIEAFLELYARRRLRDLPDSLTVEVIHIVRPLALMLYAVLIRSVDGLTPRHIQLVFEVPLHRLQLDHAGRVAADVIRIWFVYR